MREVSADVRTLKRLKIAAFVLLISGAVVGLRLFQFQIIQHDQLSAKSEQQYLRTLKLEPKRGTIYDRNGKELAVSVSVNSLYANPRETTITKTSTNRLAFILGISPEELAAKLRSPKHFIWLWRKIPPRKAESIAALNIKGLGVVKENKRYYPKRTLAAQILGFVGTDNEGLEGLEYMYDAYVGGEPSLVLVKKDAKGRNIYASRRILKEGSKGLDILLNIDETVQYIAEKELARQVVESRARGGVAIVMDPHSGEVLALAHQPSFNPNSFLDYRPARWKRSAISDAYEPGSTFKIVTLAAVLEEGLAQPDEILYAENGTLVVAGKSYHDVHNYHWLTTREVISKSSNIGTIKLGQRVEPDLMYRYIRNFGFGSKTDIGLPGEAAGLVRETEEWSGVSLSSISIGYEISVTPIQLITAYAAVANGGHLVNPRVVRGVMKEGRLIKEFPGLPARRVISDKTAEIITSILMEVVTVGTGQTAAVPGYDVAGKTGTALKFDIELGAYSSSKYVASFVGYLPADDPRVVILVLIDEPKGSFYGSEVAAPTFSRIASQVARYMKIPARNNLLIATAPDTDKKVKGPAKKGEGISNILKRIDRGLKELLVKAVSPLMIPMKGKAASYRTNEDSS